LAQSLAMIAGDDDDGLVARDLVHNAHQLRIGGGHFRVVRADVRGGGGVDVEPQKKGWRGVGAGGWGVGLGGRGWGGGGGGGGRGGAGAGGAGGGCSSQASAASTTADAGRSASSFSLAFASRGILSSYVSKPRARPKRRSRTNAPTKAAV